MGEPGQRAEEPGQDGGGRAGLPQRPLLPEEHGRHAVQPVS